MNSNQFSQSFSLFLPPLNAKSRVRPGNAGEWHYQTTVAFDEVADSLLLPDSVKETGSVSSIPDMWARPLLMEMVLHNNNHPLHSQIKAQWKGMIAVIALAEVQGLKIKAELLDLSKLKSDLFVSSLLKLIPSKERAIYQLDGRKNPWESIYVFLLQVKPGQDKPVGMTSPTTLVCPAEDGGWNDLPWWSNGRLQSPIEPEDHLNDDEKIQLWHWLKNLLDELNKQRRDATKIKEIVREFQNELVESLGVDPHTQNLRLSSRQNYFGVTIQGGALNAFNSPIAAKAMPSSVELRFHQAKGGATPPIIIPDAAQDITKQWHQKSKNIWIYGATNLVSFNLEEFKKKYKDVVYLTIDELFLDAFYFIKGANNLPGACLLKGSDSITYNIQDDEQHLTPLLPLNPKLLNYFTPEELADEIIELQSINLSGNQSGVCVRVKLPLSGGTYVVTKNYPILEENAIKAIPFLEVWPNFRAEGWQEYYTFYFDDRIEKSQKTFQVYFPSARETHPSELKDFQITRLEEFPSLIICQEPTKSANLGLILLKTPPKVGDKDPNKTWTVGVDFGTSFTNVYYKNNRGAAPLTLSLLPLQVTATSEASRIGLLYDYFMSAVQQKLPLSTVLTTKGNRGQIRPVFDGRIYIPEDIKTFDPKDDDIKTDLKWETDNLSYNRLFLKHLALLITAEAAKNDVRNLEWSISYPSAFSRSDKNLYFVTWQNIIEKLGAKTGIIHQWLPAAKGKPFRPESLAIAHYFAEKEGRDLVYTTCIDMGGGTSDISIWLGNRLIHQCSILLAGQLLFSQFLKPKSEFLNEQFNVNLSDLAKELEDEPFYVKLDAILLGEGQKWLKEKRALLDENSDLQEIIQRSAIGISGLYYYIGMILQALHLEGKYDRQQITPVYIGGNGSRILNWLALGGQFDNNCDAYYLFSRMLSKGSGFADTKEETWLSSQPKAEVACGLVLDQRETKLTGLDQDYEDDVIAGEDCYVDGKLISWTSRLRLDGEVKKFEVQELSNLQNFLDDFHAALRDLRINSIKPLQEYKNDKNNSGREKLWSDTKRGLKADLLKMTGTANDIRVEPPFILGLKSLLRILARR